MELTTKEKTGPESEKYKRSMKDGPEQQRLKWKRLRSMKDSGASSIPAGSEPSGYVYASLWRMPQRIDCEPNGITIR